MESVLNELSVIEMAASEAEARQKMIELLELQKVLNEYKFNRLRLPNKKFFLVNLSEGYTLNNWLNDASVSRTLKTLFMGIKAYPYFEELDEDAENQFITSTYYLNEPDHPSNNSEVDGLADAYLRNTLAISFLTHFVWEKCIVSINDKNENLDVIHASSENCLNKNFKEWYKKRNRPPLNSYADVDLWFPLNAGLQLSNKSKDDLIYWYQQNQMDKVLKIESFIDEIKTTPFTGSGQVEPLKENLSGWWSRRINQEHRLVYKIESDTIIICSCRGHYNNLACH